MIHRRTHPTPVEGCDPCKWASVNFGTVPGAHKDSKTRISRLNRREKELFRYAEKRKAGEQPDNTTFEGIEAAERRSEMFDRREKDLRDENPPEVVKQIKKAVTNVEA